MAPTSASFPLHSNENKQPALEVGVRGGGWGWGGANSYTKDKHIADPVVAEFRKRTS